MACSIPTVRGTMVARLPFATRQLVVSAGPSGAGSSVATNVTASPIKIPAACHRGFVSLVSSFGRKAGTTTGISSQALCCTSTSSSGRPGTLDPYLYRCLSSQGERNEKQGDDEEISKDGGEEKDQSARAKAAPDGENEGEVSKEEQLETKIKDLKDQLLRSLAEQENIRTIAKRDVTSAKSFAVTSFAKSLLDTSDNLSRAMESVPEEYRNDMEKHPVLATLYEGIKLTDENLLKAFAKNGLIRYGEVGEPFDPNLHDALFEYPDPNQEVGTIGQVMKAGFKLNERVIRPAEVGVVKKA